VEVFRLETDAWKCGARQGTQSLTLLQRAKDLADLGSQNHGMVGVGRDL